MLDLLEIRERNLKYEKGRKLKELFEKLKERIKNSEFKNIVKNIQLLWLLGTWKINYPIKKLTAY